MAHALIARYQGCKGLVIAVSALAYPVLFLIQLAHAALLADRTTGLDQSFEKNRSKARPARRSRPRTGRRKIPLLLESGFVFNRPTIYEPNPSADDDRF